MCICCTYLYIFFLLLTDDERKVLFRDHQAHQTEDISLSSLRNLREIYGKTTRNFAWISSDLTCWPYSVCLGECLIHWWAIVIASVASVTCLYSWAAVGAPPIPTHHYRACSADPICLSVSVCLRLTLYLIIPCMTPPASYVNIITCRYVEWMWWWWYDHMSVDDGDSLFLEGCIIYPSVLGTVVLVDSEILNSWNVSSWVYLSSQRAAVVAGIDLECHHHLSHDCRVTI